MMMMREAMYSWYRIVPWSERDPAEGLDERQDEEFKSMTQDNVITMQPLACVQYGAKA